MKILSIFVLCLFYFLKLINAQATIFDTYTWTGDVGNYSFVIYGTMFSIEDNFVTVNSIAAICSRPTYIDSSQTVQRLVCPPSIINSKLEEGGDLVVYMKTYIGGPMSNIQNWKLYKQISVTLKDMNTSGGAVTLSGQFSKVNIDQVKVKIDGADCQVLSVTPTQVQFKSPQKQSIGLYPFSLIVSGFEYKANINYVYGVAPTLDNKYSWKKVNGMTLLVVSGKYFSQDSDNIIKVNGVDYAASTADAPFGSQANINLKSDAPTNSIVEGSSFQVSIKVGGQSSDVKTFELVKPSITKTPTLFDIGGIAVLEGTFGTGSSSLLRQFTISTATILLQTINTTAIKFQYSINVGTYAMVLNLGGCELTTQITSSATPSPIINKYTWASNGVLNLYGQWFGYYVPNSVYINNGNGDTVQTASLSNGYDVLVLTPSTAMPSLGDSFSVKVTVKGRSTTVNFIYMQSISMQTLPIYRTGGIATFTGLYTVSNPNVVSLTIDGTQCNVTTISPTSITFIYPSKAIGQYTLLIYIGGYEYSTTVQYTNPPTPTLLKTYRWSSTGQMIFTGTGISYVNPNQFIINGTNYGATLAVASLKPGYDDITFTDKTLPSSILQEDQLFTVQVSTNTLLSNVVSFNFIKNISMNVVNIYSVDGLGGSVFTTINGTYGTSNKEIASLTIGSVQCTINSISPTSIVFSHNSNFVLGYNSISLNIGGLMYYTSINVISPPTPTLLYSYYWSNDIIVLKGSIFSYNSPNKVVINGFDYNSSPATLVNGNDEITFYDDFATSSLTIGQPFTVYVSNWVQDSNSVTFLYIKSISINTSVDIYSIDGLGGRASTIFSGLFGTTNNSAVSLYIGDVECNVNSIEQSLIDFSHSNPFPLGSNNVWISIGGFEYNTTVNVISPPKPILLNSYSWSADDNLVLKGSTFNYKSSNKVNVNGVDFDSPVATFLNHSIDQIIFDDSAPTSSLTLGQSFTVYVNNGIENSNSVTFVYLRSISITTKSLNNTGGNATFSGDYYVSDTSLVSLSIDGVEVQITDISPNTISFQYPSKTIGEYNLLIKIGGFEYLTTVQYVTKPTPSPSQTTATQTTESQTTNSQTTESQTTGGSQTTESQTTGGNQTTESQTTGGTQTTESQTTGGTQTTESQTTSGTPTTESQTTGTQTTNTQTTSTQTTAGTSTSSQTSSKPELPSDELSISFKLPISFILITLSLFLLLL
ncbi:hypothetical protein ACTFIU_008376 [Dictyostelium citrinum]